MVGIIQKLKGQIIIIVRVDDVAFGIADLTIAPSSACLLIESFDRLRDTIMDRVANVWLIDPHTERLRSDQFLNTIRLEVALNPDLVIFPSILITAEVLGLFS